MEQLFLAQRSRFHCWNGSRQRKLNKTKTVAVLIHRYGERPDQRNPSMKNENRARAKTSAAKVPAQTENQAVLPFSFELDRAVINVAQQCAVIAQNPYQEAYYRLTGLYGAIKHHPHFRTIASAMKTFCEETVTVNSFAACDCYAIKEQGDIHKQYTCAEREAMAWFFDYYRSLQGQSFTNAIISFSGFHSWINKTQSFRPVVVALQRIIASGELLENYALAHGKDSDVNFFRKYEQSGDQARDDAKLRRRVLICDPVIRGAEKGGAR